MAVPSSSATRAARLRQAMRRGSITSTFPAHQRGTSVDLPEPVGEDSTTGPRASAASKAPGTAWLGKRTSFAAPPASALAAEHERKADAAQLDAHALLVDVGRDVARERRLTLREAHHWV